MPAVNDGAAGARYAHPIMNSATELDVRVIAPREKHPTIHARLDALTTGEMLTIVNDHDPRPLRFELEADYPGRYAWEYVESGPETWRVNIRRTE